MGEAVSPTGQKSGALPRTFTNLLASPRQTTWILLNGPRPADDQTKAWIEQFRQRVPELNWAVQLATEFKLLLHEKRSDELSNWLVQAAQSPLLPACAVM